MLQYNRDKYYFFLFCLVFWVDTTLPFVLDELFPFALSLKNIVAYLGELVLIYLACKTMRSRVAFVFTAALVGVGFVSTVLVNHSPILLYVNGLREYVGLICCAPITYYMLSCEHAEEIRKSFDRQLYIWLIIQGLCVVWQFIRYGAGDHGGGGMGNYSSGNLSLMVIAASYYLTTRNWDADNYLRSLWQNRKYIVLMYPILLNETKASFLFVALYFILLFKFEVKTLIKFVASLPAIAIGLVLMGFAYIMATNQDASEIFSVEYIDAYLNAGDEDTQILAEKYMDGENDDLDEDEILDLSRFFKMTEMWAIAPHYPGGIWLGAGMGLYKGGTFVSKAKYYVDNFWIAYGTRTMYMLFFTQLGLFGVLWYCLYVPFSLRLNKNPDYIGLTNKVMVLCIFAFIFIYSTAGEFTYFDQLLYYIVAANTFPSTFFVKK